MRTPTLSVEVITLPVDPAGTPFATLPFPATIPFTPFPTNRPNAPFSIEQYVPAMATKHVILVLIHGAWADGSSWARVIAAFKSKT